MRFDGFNPDGFAFYDELERDNTREWWLANKARYDEHVRAPAEALAAELEPEFGPLKIFRPYKDVRFSADKRPYKDHLGMVSTSLTEPALYLQFSQHGLVLGGGLYQPSREQLARFRELVDDSRSAEDVAAAVARAEAAGFALTTEGKVATAPRGYRTDHPRIDLLRLTRLAISRRYPQEDWMLRPEAFDTISADWRVVSAWNDWLAAAIRP